MIEYRGFDIYMGLEAKSQDMYQAWYRLTKLRISDLGGRVKVRRGPFTRRWAYLIAELAGKAEIDILLGIEGYYSC